MSTSVSQNNNVRDEARQRVACRIPHELLDLVNSIANSFQSPYPTTKSLIDHIVESALRDQPWIENAWPDLRPRRASDYSGVPTGYSDYAVKLPGAIVQAVKRAIDDGAAASIPSFMLLAVLWWIAYRRDDQNTHKQLRGIQRKYELPYPYDAASLSDDGVKNWVPGNSKGDLKPIAAQRIHDVLLVGLDAAADLRNFGCATGRIQQGSHRIDILDARLLDNEAGLLRLASTLTENSRCLIAIDAPLGWPRAMGDIQHHLAGQRIAGEANQFFRRLTDRRVKERTGKLPLDVGADRIARAAFQALRVLDTLAARSGKPVRLAWSPADVEPGYLNVVEVYPAATLQVIGLPSSGYKKNDQLEQRKIIVDGMHGILSGIHHLIDQSDDMFDAALCLLAGRDFLLGHASPPQFDEMPAAAKEGWIWVRDGR